MKNNELYKLSSYSNKKNKPKKRDNLFKGISRLVLNKIKNIITNNNAILLHECSEFKDFDGRDVDAFYFSNKNLNTNCEDDVILYNSLFFILLSIYLKKLNYPILVND